MRKLDGLEGRIMKIVKRLKYSLIFLFLALTILLFSHIFDFDIFETIFEFFESFEEYELDELVIFFIILSFGIITDAVLNTVRLKHERALDEEKLKLFNNTMHEVHDIVNNFLNNMQYFTYEAKSSEALPAEQLEEIEEIIQETSRKLREMEK